MISSPASAHFLWMDPVGQLATAPGSLVSVECYLHADQADVLYMWSTSLGFDSLELDTDTGLGDTILYGATALGPGLLPPTCTAGGSVKYPGQALIKNISRSSLIDGESLHAGEDFLLFTANFTFAGGAWSNEDAWAEWVPKIDGFDMESGYYNTLGIYSDSTGSVLLENNGPDYTPIPIPNAIWLISLGLLCLAGLRRWAEARAFGLQGEGTGMKVQGKGAGMKAQG